MMSMINRETAVDRNTKKNCYPCKYCRSSFDQALCYMVYHKIFTNAVHHMINYFNFILIYYSYANAMNCACIPSVNGTTEKYCQPITFLCIQYLAHVYIKLGHYDNSNANIEDDKYLAT